MLLTKNVLVAVTCIATLSLASSSSSSTNGELKAGNIVQTTTWDTTTIAAGTYKTVTKFVSKFARNMALSIGGWNKGDCHTIQGTFEDVKWTYYPSRPNCGTSGQYDDVIVIRAIKDYLHNNHGHNNTCATQCLRMDEGGSWDGWLKLGSTNAFDEQAYCGPTLTFDSCFSGCEQDL
ncbi:uncharacterized protein P174DRAFT_438187 [Aspergillus novofumigatus IBT 16806]|uniref:Secreted protein CSS2 C-terminal domain-containing protein n=1 Tax=Aspergillus novofumigatus (strain IBT 16806) TaxID=1392255 RepID=A0A2I1CFK2_ASPN1|nr:uncharacterized protein P174DRAFT_438187 [Aspergillus novofumigatus IBT 16806]PKX96402.1 hypothetical protein P174DRAFT_438187 [Aspergillus novofumigatus IBT 16806]